MLQLKIKKWHITHTIIVTIKTFARAKVFIVTILVWIMCHFWFSIVAYGAPIAEIGAPFLRSNDTTSNYLKFIIRFGEWV